MKRVEMYKVARHDARYVINEWYSRSISIGLSGSRLRHLNRQLF